jgi:hypothetical protein
VAKSELKTLRQRASADETLAEIARERRRYWIVWTCGVLSVLAFAVFSIGEVVAYFRLDPGIERIDFQSEAKRVAVKLFFDQIAMIGNLSLASLGVLWAFVLQKSNRIEVRRPRERILFVSTKPLLGSVFDLPSVRNEFID